MYSASNIIKPFTHPLFCITLPPGQILPIPLLSFVSILEDSQKGYKGTRLEEERTCSRARLSQKWSPDIFSMKKTGKYSQICIEKYGQKNT